MPQSYKTEVSQVSEITDGWVMRVIRNLAAATFWGALAGTASVIGLLVITSPNDPNLVGDIGGAVVFFGFFVSIFTLAGVLLIGLPITLLLHRLKWEHRAFYAALGAIAGFLAIALPSEISLFQTAEEIILPVAGALAGMAAAFRWGKWRQQTVEHLRVQSSARSSAKPANRIHDLLF